jgi:DNA polymerase IV
MKNIVHIDLNAFFAQCEENCNPKYKNLPLAVGYDGKRGVISTSNYIARKYGVHSAMPTYKAKQLCKDLIIVNGRYDLYSKVSSNFMSYLKSRYKLVEVASIDEAYIDMTGYFEKENARSYLLDLQLDIYKKLSLKCSIGYSYNRFLAKMSSDLVKPMGLTICLDQDYKNLFWGMDISNMYGIGKKTTPKLKNLGINTIKDLALVNPSVVEPVLGSSTSTLISWANGEGSDIIDPSPFDPKSISNATTLYDDTNDIELLADTLKQLTYNVVDQLKQYKKKTNTVVITLRDTSFKTRSKRETILPTSDFESIYNKAVNILYDFYKGEDIRLIGISLDNIESNQNIDTITLFNQDEDIKNSLNKSKNIIDDLNKSLSKPSLMTLKDYMEKKNEN